MKEYYYDKLLNIRTNGKGSANRVDHYHPYEPTPYHALEVLFRHYELHSYDRVVDFGCGKGRLNFYVHYFYHARVLGIDMNEKFYRQALENLEQYGRKNKKELDKIDFQCCLAESYTIDPNDNRFYFFNPFSIEIFMRVIHNIWNSFEENNREIDVILYYPSEEYIHFLEHKTNFEQINEIVLPNFYEDDPSERFNIYQIR
ncbi:Methyltransferase domain-containing protein [Oceanobacillus limi]|uniref:Methyltransferase domain-containing protein n=1 Tax=Oceanobacillus limi TaxID=930131 RepID=A0A1I0B8V6_9BACI|nr:methyltransferase [Oceanobacillus limi]SET03218.1 Methyltransferase domain-containing protein [Oceanobacillus limi]